MYSEFSIETKQSFKKAKAKAYMPFKCSGANSIDMGQVPQFYKWLGTGGGKGTMSFKHETDQTVLTIMKALTRMTNCACRAKKTIFPAFCTG